MSLNRRELLRHLTTATGAPKVSTGAGKNSAPESHLPRELMQKHHSRREFAKKLAVGAGVLGAASAGASKLIVPAQAQSGFNIYAVHEGILNRANGYCKADTVNWLNYYGNLAYLPTQWRHDNAHY